MTLIPPVLIALNVWPLGKGRLGKMCGQIRDKSLRGPLALMVARC